jgi:hypothetical protein
MMGGTTEVVAALAILIVFLFGITFGVVGVAVHGSRRGALLAPASDDLVSAGARVIYAVFTRDDEGYLQGHRRGNGRGSGGPRGDDGPASPGQEADR